LSILRRPQSKEVFQYGITSYISSHSNTKGNSGKLENLFLIFVVILSSGASGYNGRSTGSPVKHIKLQETWLQVNLRENWFLMHHCTVSKCTPETPLPSQQVLAAHVK